MDRKQRAEALRLSGKTWAEIGRELGVTRQRAWQLVQGSGLDSNGKTAIKVRDGFICQWQEACKDGTRQFLGLDVHHVDSNPRNNNEDNLITLCKKCHRLFHEINKRR